MKKTIVALALVAATAGAFAQTAPLKKSKAPVVTAKTDTTKKAKSVKKVSKKKAAKKM